MMPVDGLRHVKINVRPNGGKLSFSEPKDPVLKKASDKALKLLQKIENAHEDEAMMIRLIKIRQSLWT